jgi:hypothetical protein
LVEVLLVVDAYVAVRLVLVLLEVMRFVMVPDADVRSVIVPLVIVVVARITVPVAVRLPVANDVDVALPSDEVPEVSVAIVAFVAVRLVNNAVTPFSKVAKKLLLVALVVTRLVIVPDADVRSEIVVVANEDVPVTVSVVKVGEADTLIVEVPVKVTLVPAVK